MNMNGGWALIKKSLFSFVASRAFFWTLTLGWMMAPMIYMFVWVVAAGEGFVSGFTKNDFITYYVALMLVNQLTYPTSHWTVGDNIFNGTFSFWLLRPMPPIFEAIASDIAVKIVCIPFIAVFVLAVSILLKVHLTLTLTLSTVLLFILCLLLAQVLRFILAYTMAIMALFTDKINSLLGINDTLVFLFAGQVIPTLLLPGVLKVIAGILPYRYMLGFPIELLLGMLSRKEILVGIGSQIAWITVIFIINRIVWKKGIKHYSAVGG